VTVVTVEVHDLIFCDPVSYQGVRHW